MGWVGERSPSKFLLLPLCHFGKQSLDLGRARWREVLESGDEGKREDQVWVTLARPVSIFYTHKGKKMWSSFILCLDQGILKHSLILNYFYIVKQSM